MKKNPTKRLLEDTLRQLHKSAGNKAYDEQWFTRVTIANQLGTPSHKLNAGRVIALEALVEDGIVVKRNKFDAEDGRLNLEFQLGKL